MITIAGIHTRIVEILQLTAPDIGIIATEKIEGVDNQRPCFNVDVIPIYSQSAMARYDDNTVTVQIRYYAQLDGTQTLQNEDIFDRLNKTFALNFGMADTALLVENKSFDEDPSLGSMTFRFDVSYHNMIAGIDHYQDILYPAKPSTPEEQLKPTIDLPLDPNYEKYLMQNIEVNKE